MQRAYGAYLHGYLERDDRRVTGRVIAWTIIVVIVVVGIVTQLVRPLAPDLGPVPDPARWFSPTLLRRIHEYRSPLRAAAVVAQLIDLVVAAAVLVTPLVVEPLQFDLRPVPDGLMRRELEAVLAADGRSRAPLLVADAR